MEGRKKKRGAEQYSLEGEPSEHQKVAKLEQRGSNLETKRAFVVLRPKPKQDQKSKTSITNASTNFAAKKQEKSGEQPNGEAEKDKNAKPRIISDKLLATPIAGIYKDGANGREIHRVAHRLNGANSVDRRNVVMKLLDADEKNRKNVKEMNDQPQYITVEVEAEFRHPRFQPPRISYRTHEIKCRRRLFQDEPDEEETVDKDTLEIIEPPTIREGEKRFFLSESANIMMAAYTIDESEMPKNNVASTSAVIEPSVSQSIEITESHIHNSLLCYENICDLVSAEKSEKQKNHRSEVPDRTVNIEKQLSGFYMEKRRRLSARYVTAFHTPAARMSFKEICSPDCSEIDKNVMGNSTIDFGAWHPPMAIEFKPINDKSPINETKDSSTIDNVPEEINSVSFLEELEKFDLSEQTEESEQTKDSSTIDNVPEAINSVSLLKEFEKYDSAEQTEESEQTKDSSTIDNVPDAMNLVSFVIKEFEKYKSSEQTEESEQTKDSSTIDNVPEATNAFSLLLKEFEKYDSSEEIEESAAMELPKITEILDEDIKLNDDNSDLPISDLTSDANLETLVRKNKKYVPTILRRSNNNGCSEHSEEFEKNQQWLAIPHAAGQPIVEEVADKSNDNHLIPAVEPSSSEYRSQYKMSFAPVSTVTFSPESDDTTLEYLGPAEIQPGINTNSFNNDGANVSTRKTDIFEEYYASIKNFDFGDMATIKVLETRQQSPFVKRVNMENDESEENGMNMPVEQDAAWENVTLERVNESSIHQQTGDDISLHHGNNFVDTSTSTTVLPMPFLSYDQLSNYSLNDEQNNDRENEHPVHGLCRFLANKESTLINVHIESECFFLGCDIIDIQNDMEQQVSLFVPNNEIYPELIELRDKIRKYQSMGISYRDGEENSFKLNDFHYIYFPRVEIKSIQESSSAGNWQSAAQNQQNRVSQEREIIEESQPTKFFALDGIDNTKPPRRIPVYTNVEPTSDVSVASDDTKILTSSVPNNDSEKSLMIYTKPPMLVDQMVTDRKQEVKASQLNGQQEQLDDAQIHESQEPPSNSCNKNSTVILHSADDDKMQEPRRVSCLDFHQNLSANLISSSQPTSSKCTNKNVTENIYNAGCSSQRESAVEELKYEMPLELFPDLINVPLEIYQQADYRNETSPGQDSEVGEECPKIIQLADGTVGIFFEENSWFSDCLACDYVNAEPISNHIEIINGFNSTNGEEIIQHHYHYHHHHHHHHYQQ